MLDEVFEYIEYADKKYSKDLTKQKKHSRLNYDCVINNSGAGLGRALSVIAKHFIHAYKNDDDYQIAESAVRAWLGLKYEKVANEQAAEEIELLKDYFESCLLDKYRKAGRKADKDKREKNIADFKKNKYENIKRNFSIQSGGGNNHSENTDSNDKNALRFERIYYTVKNHRPKVMVMIADCDIFKEYTIKRYKNNKYETLNEKDQDHILKIIAAYLIKRIVDDSAAVKIEMVDIGNWSVKTRKEDYYTINQYLLMNPERPLFNDVLSSKGTKRIKIEDELIKHFRLVNKEDIVKEANIGDIVYIDEGKNLLKNVAIKSEDDTMRVLQE